VFAGVAISPPAAARGAILDGLGAIGTESSSDNPGSVPALLQEHRGLNFGGPGLPYAYGHTGADSQSVLLPGNQVDQLVPQATAGNITLAILDLGNNDYLEAGEEIISGALSGAALAAFHAQVAANVATVTNAVQTAGAGVVMGGISNLIYSPAVAEEVTDPLQLAAFSNAMAAGEALVADYALSHGIPYIDFFQLLTDVYVAGSAQIGGVDLILTGYSADPHYFWSDPFHTGVLVRGAIANFYLQAINERFGTNIPLLSDLELLALGGLEDEYEGETFAASYDYDGFVSVPEPSALDLSALALAAFALAGVARVKPLARRDDPRA
jgi:hypothetical protein